MVDAGFNGMREKGCEHLSKLETERVKEIGLNNMYQTGRDEWIKVH